MKVLCIQGYEGLLIESEVYTVYQVTSNGNYLLEELKVPEGYTSFNKNRFVPLISTDLNEWTEEMEQQYWEEQPNLQIFKIWGMTGIDPDVDVVPHAGI